MIGLLFIPLSTEIIIYNYLKGAVIKKIYLHVMNKIRALVLVLDIAMKGNIFTCTGALIVFRFMCNGVHMVPWCVSSGAAEEEHVNQRSSRSTRCSYSLQACRTWTFTSLPAAHTHLQDFLCGLSIAAHMLAQAAACVDLN